MDVVNVDTADTITLDDNATFLTAKAGDVALAPGDAVRVCSNGSKWYQVEDKVSASGIDGYSLDAADGSPTDALYVDYSGNVGIGTTTPASLLDSSSATGGIVTLSRNDTSATADDSIGKLQFWNNDTELTTQKIYANIEAFAKSTVTTDAAAGYLVFRTTGTGAGGSPTERMRIDEAGNVAIGTTVPDQKLSVAGTIE